jgi:hypothetical protein
MIDLNPYAIAVFALIACILVVTWPGWRRHRRHVRLAHARRARRFEDLAWQSRREEAALARRLRWARYDVAARLAGHSLSTADREEFGRGLGEIEAVTEYQG